MSHNLFLTLLLVGAPIQVAGEESQDPVLLQAAQLRARGLQADDEGPRRRQDRRPEKVEDPKGGATGMVFKLHFSAPMGLGREE